MHDWAKATLILAFGLLSTGTGLLVYLRREMPRPMVIFLNAVPLYYRGNVYAVLPVGVGFSLGGVADLVWRDPYSSWLFVVSLVSCGVGVVLIFWHPNWIRPRSMRGPVGD